MPGFIFYEGKSLIDGLPIVGIATTETSNPKTGPMVQTWILRSDISPLEAVASGQDFSVCGDCPLRGVAARGCYVNVGQAPRAVWAAYKAEKYRPLAKSESRFFIGKGLRYGAYGDPVAIPLDAWKLLEKLCTGRIRTGYTHQWAMRRFARWSTRVMASVHTVSQAATAQAAGWRTFRAASPLNFAPSPGEIVCPASPEGGDRRTCAECGACNGRRDMADRRVSIAIVSHGRGKRIASSVAEMATV